MDIYTRTGDAGETGLFGGQRVPKHDLRIGAYGAVDEFNAFLGWAAVAAEGEIEQALRREQARLFDLGAHLATPPDATEGVTKALPEWESDCCTMLEGEIDAWERELPELKTFILPGGNELSARIHVARTVGRRAERKLCHLSGRDPAQPEFHAYLNRLGDWLFVLARFVGHQAGVEETTWRPRAKA